MSETQQTIPGESLYPPGEQPSERMQLSELGITEKPPVAQPAQNTQAVPAQKQPPVADFKQINTSKRDDGSTYYLGGSEGSGILEVDLVSFREKGKETRFLSFVIANIDKSGEQPQKYQLSMTLDSEEKFKEFKQFVANLNWED